MYHVFLCLDGIKSKYVEHIYLESKEDFRHVIATAPFDIIEEDAHNVWFDYGDE